MSSSTILLILLGMFLLGNTIVGGLPDKLLALAGSSSTSSAKLKPVANPHAVGQAGAAVAAGAAALGTPTKTPARSSSSGAGG